MHYNVGKNNSFYGKRHSEVSKEKNRQAHLGKKLSEEHKKKISKTLKGRISPLRGGRLSEEHKRKIGKARKGMKFSKEWRVKISKAVKGKMPKGNNHWNWKGGITPENIIIKESIEFRLWREAVFARDNWTCQKYGIKSSRLEAHHIQNFAEYPELRTSIENGITLSEKAHKEFHKKYGTKNNTKEQLEEFLNS